MKTNKIFAIIFSAIFFLLSNNGCDSNSTDSGSDLPSAPVVSSLSGLNYMPSSLLVIEGSGFGTGENLYVRFSDADNFEIDVPVLESADKSLVVSVPPYFNPADGVLRSDTVGIQVVKKSGTASVESNLIENFIIEDLPVPVSAAGTVTFNFLVWELSNYQALQLEIEGTELDIPSITDAISENITNLQTLAAQIYGVSQNMTPEFSVGTINGVDIKIGPEEILQCDRLILAMFSSLGNTDFTSLLKSQDLSPGILSKAYAPCPSEALDQMEFLQRTDGYTSNNHYDCVASSAPDAVKTAYYVVAGAGTAALGVLALAGAPAIALAVPAAAIIYATIMTSGMQITIGSTLKNINNSAAVAAIHNGVDQIEDMCTGMLTGMVLPGASGPIKDIWDGIGMLGKAFTSTAPACSYTLSEYSKPFISAGGTGSFSVTSGSGCTWSAVSGAAWIIITSGISGTGNGTIIYSVKPNSTSQQRSGSITVQDKYFTITQAGTGSQSGSFDGYWEGTYDGVHTYSTGGTYEYVDEPLDLTIDGTVITGGAPTGGTGTIDAAGNGSWSGQSTSYNFTGTFSANGTASGTWTRTIPGTGPQSGTGTGTWTAVKTD